MTLQAVDQFLTNYGMIAVFVIVFLEYLGLPGFPAGIIMPAAGIFVARNGKGFIIPLLLSILAGLLASTVLYFLGLIFGTGLLGWSKKKFPNITEKLNKALDYIREKGYIGIFISRLIPAVRTMTSIPAGIVKLNIAKYIIFSAFGIACWNLVFIGAGFIFGEVIFTII